MALQHGDKGICERCRRAVPLAVLNNKGFCRACAVAGKSVTEMALAASLDMEAIVKDVVEAGVKDWARALGRKLEPKQKAARDRLNDLEKAVKALPTVQEEITSRQKCSTPSRMSDALSPQVMCPRRES